eukprot:10492171-Alexandrium_andersonii.AAC.1
MCSSVRVCVCVRAWAANGGARAGVLFRCSDLGGAANGGARAGVSIRSSRWDRHGTGVVQAQGLDDKARFMSDEQG